MTRLAVIIAFGALFAASSAKSDDSYSFVLDYVRQLGRIEDIQYVAEQELSRANSEQMAECVNNSTSFQLEIDDDIRMLRSFHLQTLVVGFNDRLADLYGVEEHLYKRLADICQLFITAPQHNVDYAMLAAEAPKIRAQLNYVQQKIFDATPLVFASLIDTRPDSNGHLSRLLISKAERDHLILMIKLGFGEKLDSKIQNYTVSSASVLLSYLEKDYKCSDDP